MAMSRLCYGTSTRELRENYGRTMKEGCKKVVVIVVHFDSAQ